MDTKQIETPVVVPDGVEYVEPEVRKMAADVAAEIRERGHWQEGKENPCDDGSGVCVGIATAFVVGGTSQRLQGLLLGSSVDARNLQTLYDWNDSTPTDVVLARLDGIAEGLVSA